LPAKRTGRRGQLNGVTDMTSPRLGRWLAWGRQDQYLGHSQRSKQQFNSCLNWLVYRSDVPLNFLEVSDTPNLNFWRCPDTHVIQWRCHCVRCLVIGVFGSLAVLPWTCPLSGRRSALTKIVRLFGHRHRLLRPMCECNQRNGPAQWIREEFSLLKCKSFLPTVLFMF